MGCCMSTEKATVHEVVLDENDVARRVPEGQGTHFIHVSSDGSTQLEKKPELKSGDATPVPNHPDSAYTKKSKLVPWDKNSPKHNSVAPADNEKN